MNVLEYAGIPSESILQKLNTSLKGLTTSESNLRLSAQGRNKLSSSHHSWIDVLRRQFASPFVYLLVGAALLSIILGELFDGIIIFIFVAINAALGFYQEYKSEQTIKLLNKYLTANIKTIRDGKEHIADVETLVPGDIISLAPGDKIPADVRFIEAYNLVIDESVLTGESAPVEKSHEVIKDPVTEIYHAKNMGFSGSIIAGGHATAVVVATGNSTEYGKTAVITNAAKKASGFEKEIARFSAFILVLVTIALVLLIVASLLFRPDQSIITFLLFAIALAVSVIPEGLPVVITFSLSLGALKLAKQKVVVKRLSAIEDLGGMEILCSDKTGTLTQNKLTVDEVFPFESENTLLYAHLAASRDTTERNQQNNAFETALYNALSHEQKKEADKYKYISEIPFDPVRKRTTSLVNINQQYVLIVRGAPEEVLKCCELTSLKKKEYNEWILNKGKQGRRILAVGSRVVRKNEIKNSIELEKDVKFEGLVSFEDPIKESTFNAIAEAEKLGVQIKMITGDSAEVAGYVAAQIKLVHSHEHVLLGHVFEHMGERERMEAVRRYHVFARVSPSQKYAIIETLQKSFRVGFLGEGINDASALKISNVALAVQGASDIAKEAADIVLLDKSLHVIVDGVRDGRAVYANTSKYILATLSANFGNFIAVATSSFFIPFLPMLPLQILLVNLLSDFPMIAVATDTVDTNDIKKPKKYNLKEFAIISLLLGCVSTAFDFIFFGLFYKSGAASLQTSWFMGSILTELLFLFSIRTRGFFLKAKLPSKSLLFLTGIAFVMTIALPLIPAARSLFKFQSYSADRLLLILSIVGAYFVMTETVKILYYRYSKQSVL